MKQQIEAALTPLLGLPLRDCWRPNIEGFQSLQRFEFGAQRPATNRQGKHLTFGEYALHVGCAWRIIGQGRILAAYIDLYYPADNPNESGDHDDFDSYQPGASQRDRQVQHFVERLDASPLFVERIEADEVGSVTMSLGRGYKLEILPMDSLPFEFWRLLRVRQRNKTEEHFVVTGRGIEAKIDEE